MRGEILGHVRQGGVNYRMAGGHDQAAFVVLLRMGLIMARYLRLFGASSIRALLADREFVGVEWISFLNKNNVPYVIRLKEDMLIRLTDSTQRQFRTLLRKPKRGTWEGWLTGMEKSPDNRLRVAAKRIKGAELLIIATNLNDAGAGLKLYRKRWGLNACSLTQRHAGSISKIPTSLTQPNLRPCSCS